MSTGATYKIYDDYHDFNVYFYIPKNNDPISGAIRYFQSMLDYMQKKQDTSYANAFYRANEDTRFTDNHHHHHPDTEYEYDFVKKLDGKMELVVREYYWKEAYGCKMRTVKVFFEGKLEDFINKYSKN